MFLPLSELSCRKTQSKYKQLYSQKKNGISDKNRFTFIISSKTKNGQASLANIKGVIVLHVDHTEEMMERIS